MLNVTARLELFSRIVDTLAVVAEDARFEFDESGVHVRLVDTSHVAMIRMDIDAAAFDAWEVDEYMIGLELVKLKNFFTNGRAKDLISMNYVPEKEICHFALGKIKRDIRPLDPKTFNPQKPPSLDHPCSVTLRGEELAQALKAARQVGELVNFSVDSDQFTIHVQGNPDSVTVDFSADELQSLKCDAPVRSQYSLSYIEDLSRVFRDIESVTLGFGESYPLEINFTFEDGSGAVTYYLAPRVENDGY